MGINAQYERWLERAAEDAALIEELKLLKGNEGEIYERFYRELEFGTAGIRGKLGAGTNRMNIYTVRRATCALARFLREKSEKPSVAIGYDSRINSDVFARESAAVLAKYGVKAWIYRELMPTPAVSFAVRELKCDAGIMITASHNPAEYNGYKVYDASGCQITGETASAVAGYITQTDIFDGVSQGDFEKSLAAGEIEYIEEELVQNFINKAVECVIDRDICKNSNLKIVYTPLNGAGRRCVLTALAKSGFKDITVVPEQEMPDGNFPTCPYPNPEIKEALALGLELFPKVGADLLLATDPDSDRVGTAVVQNGKPRTISGNEMGVLLLEYIASARTARGTMPERPVAVKSIVSTTMADLVADSYGIEMKNVLTGFKYIGEQIALLEEKHEENRFIFGFEESYGYLSGSFVRDKDAVSTSVLICEMAAWYKENRGCTLADAIDSMYEKYGHFLNKVDSYSFDGSDGMEKMKVITCTLRNNLPEYLGDIPVSYTADYLTGEKKAGGAVLPIRLPRADVLELGMKHGSVIVRPSGTEPKLKLYYSISAHSREAVEEIYRELRAQTEKLLGL